MKDNTDSGQFLAIQEACATRWITRRSPQKIAAKYSRRMDGLVKVLNKFGFGASKPKGSFFLYVRCPRRPPARMASGSTFDTAEAFSQWMITEKLISTVPWDDAGAYVRFSVTFIAKDVKRRAARAGRDRDAAGDGETGVLDGGATTANKITAETQRTQKTTA